MIHNRQQAFASLKKSILSRTDKSRKGSIDAPILPLIEALNTIPCYCTTRSCSGRTLIIVMASYRKDAAAWAFVTHNKAAPGDVISCLSPLPKGEAWFRFEPAILHVACAAIADAQRLVNVARDAGFKRSGIQGSERKIVVEILSTEFIAAPIGKDGNLLVPESYLSVLVADANRKMERNWGKIGKLCERIQKEKVTSSPH